MSKKADKTQSKSTPRSDYFRVQITMDMKMNDFLEHIGSTCKKQHGFKLSKCEIVRALIDALADVEKEIDLTEVKSEKVLTERIVEAFKVKYSK